MDQEMPNHLKRCPFCGGNSIDVRADGSVKVPYYYARCSDCGARTGMHLSQGPAKDAWNRRARPSK